MIARIVQHSFSKIELSRKYNLQNVCKYCKLDRPKYCKLDRPDALKTESSSFSTFPRSQTPLFSLVLCVFPLVDHYSYCTIPVLMDFWHDQVLRRKYELGKHFVFFKLLTLHMIGSP